MHAPRPLPDELLALVADTRAREEAARTRPQKTLAVLTTAHLLMACIDAGWRIHEIAPLLRLKRTTASKRVEVARQRGVSGAGFNVPPAPRKPPSRPKILAVPAEEREWLTAPEAAQLADVDRSTIPRWDRAGALPNTWRVIDRRPLYLRADVLRLAQAPRWRNGGVRHDEFARERRADRPSDQV